MDIHQINKLFESHPIYHLFAGSIKFLENKYIVKEKDQYHHISFDDIVGFGFKHSSSFKFGYLKIEYKKHNKINQAVLRFNEKSQTKMHDLFETLKNKHNK